jgi:nickel/cobalt exporter
VSALAATGLFLGLVHTVAGPDHYVPFIAMARSARWSAARTTAVTITCGLAHVGSSLLLGLLGIALGWQLSSLEWFENTRGDLVAWLFIGFGLAYTVWGVRRAWTRRPHTHWHGHADGAVHVHEHVHVGEHAQAHTAELAPGVGAPDDHVRPWALFLLFVFGPCEPLIPLLMYPAAERNWSDVVLVAACFAATTLLAMVCMVFAGLFGLSLTSLGRMERYDHALAGIALLACGIAIRMGL